MGTSVDERIERVRRFAMPQGEVAPCDFRLAQQGEMRLAPGQPWCPFRAEQQMSGALIDFSWRAWFRMTPLTPVRVTDCFERGKGALTASLTSAPLETRGLRSFERPESGMSFERGFLGVRQRCVRRAATLREAFPERLLGGDFGPSGVGYHEGKPDIQSSVGPGPDLALGGPCERPLPGKGVDFRFRPVSVILRLYHLLECTRRCRNSL